MIRIVVHSILCNMCHFKSLYLRYNLYYFVHMQKGRFSLDYAHLYRINEQSQEKTCLFAYAQKNGTYQLHSNCAADQHPCFRHIHSIIHLLLKSEVSNLWLYSWFCVRPGRKPWRQVISRNGSNLSCSGAIPWKYVT